MSNKTEAIFGSTNMVAGKPFYLVTETCSHGSTTANGPFTFVEWESYGARARVYEVGVEGPSFVISFSGNDGSGDSDPETYLHYSDIDWITPVENYKPTDECGCQ